MATELSTATARAWLNRHGIGANPVFTELGGGISNKVLLAEAPGFRAVLKQSLGRLRVESEWVSDRSRIFREASAMRLLAGQIQHACVPRLLIEDEAEFAIAMEAAPASAVMWKTKLFARALNARALDPEDARTAGKALGAIAAASWNHPEARRLFGDQTVFEQLRIDPYYRCTAERHPSLAPYFHDLIRLSAARQVCLVHGDFSPKNLLFAGRELWIIDWEVVHFGDPSFDAAFLLNHLVLKSIAMPDEREAFATLAREFLAALESELPPDAAWVPGAALEHLPALLLARVDGKSPAEYLDAPMQTRARTLALNLIAHPAPDLAGVFQR